jgi:head-tail adaptor
MPAEVAINAGDLRHRVTIRRNTPVYDAANQPQPKWNDWLTRWGKVESIAGSDFIQDAQIRNSSSHVITMRFVPGLDPKTDQIVYGSRTFNLTGLADTEERGIVTVAYAKEVI